MEVAQSFLHHYLPSDVKDVLDIRTLEPQKDSFINQALEESFSDLSFSADIDGKEGYVYFLFEHKSYPDKAAILQLLKYMADIWHTRLNKQLADQLPVILPLVVYHGASSWNIETTLGGMITGYEELSSAIKRFVPNYEYSLYDISAYTDDEIKGEARLKILLTMFRDVQKAANVQELLLIIDKAITYLQELNDKRIGMVYFETFINYIFATARNVMRQDVEEIVDRIENTYPEGSELVMTLADILREEGKEEGKEVGREEGKEQGIKAVAFEMLRRGFTVEVVAEVTYLDAEEVKRLNKEIQ